jgi:FMN-dependent NADH-azoreductase
LEGKKAIIVAASGGVPIDSPIDFATPHLRQVLNFIGITDITTVAAKEINATKAEVVA